MESVLRIIKTGYELWDTSPLLHIVSSLQYVLRRHAYFFIVLCFNSMEKNSHQNKV